MTKAKDLSDITTIEEIHARFRIEDDQVVWNTADRRHFKREQDWKVFNKRDANKVAGCLIKPSPTRHYRYIGFNGKLILAHRIAYVLHHNTFPPVDKDIDHIDGNGLNNSKENLRLATSSQNGCNRGKQKNNKSGYKGVGKRGDKWVMKIKHKGKEYWQGGFNTPEEAHAAYIEMSNKLHKDFGKVA